MQGATSLAGYDHRHFGRFAAATTHRFGKGRVTCASAREGRRLWFVSNWAWEPVTVPMPVAGVSLLWGRGVREGGSVGLGVGDVDIVVEA